MATDTHDQVTQRIPTAPHMDMVEMALIVESLTNPRKHFDQAKLNELADSIAEAGGVFQPVLLRPLPGSRVPETYGGRRKDAPLPAYELVAGARRFRANRMCGMAYIPAMVRDLTDDQALEIQLIENLQREGMTELEEAEGYRALMDHSKLTVDQVAEKIGKKDKGRSYVYARLKLLELHTDARKALQDGQIDNSRALRIARIPDAKLQAKALIEATRKSYNGVDYALGVREFESWLQTNVMLRLEGAPFSTVAVDLLPAAGSCKDCPNRTGANPDLFADVNSPDLCTLPKCYHAKVDAHAAQLRAKAEAKGMTVIAGKEAKAVVEDTWRGTYLKGYSRLDSTRTDTSDGNAISLRDMLGDDGPQTVLIEHPKTKELIEAVPTEEAEALLVQRGKLKTTSTKIDVEQRVSALKGESHHKQERLAAKAVQRALLDAAHKSPQPAKVLADAELLREWLKLKVEDYDGEDKALITGIEEIEDEGWEDTEKRAIARISRAKDGDVRNMMLACVLLEFGYQFSRETGQALVAAAARALGVDVATVKAEAVADEKQTLADAIANVQAAAKAQEERPAVKPAAPKGASTPPPAAQASNTRAKGKGQKTPAAPAGDTAPKTSAAHAKAQIAEALTAMQDQIQAPAAQGDDAPAVPVGQPVATALSPATAWPFPTSPAKASPKPSDRALPKLKNKAPAAQGDDAPPIADAQASAAPSGQAAADVSTVGSRAGAHLEIGVAVRVLPTATGKKQAPHIGKTGQIFRRIGPEAWDVSIPREKRGVPMFVAFHASELEVVLG